MDLIQAIAAEAGVYPPGAQNRQGERTRYVACRFKLPAIVACVYGEIEIAFTEIRQFETEGMGDAYRNSTSQIIIYIALFAKKFFQSFFLSDEVRADAIVVVLPPPYINID